jgi:hypothetical protein
MAPSGCPDAARVRQSVLRLLRSPPATGKTFSARASVTRTRSGWHAEIHTNQADVSGHRSLDSEKCEDLADATALIVALMIDPNALVRDTSNTGTTVPAPVAPAPSPLAPLNAASPPSGDPSSAATASPPGAPAAAPHAISPPTPQPVISPPEDTQPVPKDRPLVPLPSRATRWFARANVAGALGTLPGVGVGFGLALGVRFGRFRVAIDGIVWPAETATVPNNAPAGGRVDLEVGGAALCAAFVRTIRLDAGPCVAFEAGRMHAVGINVSTKSEGAALWAAVGAGGYASLLLVSPLALSLEAGVLAPVASPQFQLADVGKAFQPAQVEGRAVFSGEVRF